MPLFVELGISVLGKAHPPEILGIVDALVVLDGSSWAGGVRRTEVRGISEATMKRAREGCRWKVGMLIN